LTLDTPFSDDNESMRRSVALSVWLAATLGASALSWTAVDRVAADVSDHPRIEGSRAIRRALDSRSSSGAGTETPVPTRPDGTPVPGGDAAGADAGRGAGGTGGTRSTDAPGGDRAGTGSAGAADRTGGTAGSGTSGNVAGAIPTTSTTVAPVPTTTRPVATGPEASVVTVGGTVTATCSGSTPLLVRAIPNAGYGVQVGGSGLQLVVTLRSSSHRSVVEVECEGSRVHFSTSEESTS
jgi:hypothetical protein